MQLYEASGDSRYCGPTALEIITGKSYPEIRTLINEHRGRRLNQGIIGTSLTDLEYVLNKCNIKFKFFDLNQEVLYPRISFPDCRRRHAKYPMLREVIAALDNSTYILHVTGHFMVLNNGQLVDNITKVPSPLNDKHKPQRKVLNLWKILIDNDAMEGFIQ